MGSETQGMQAVVLKMRVHEVPQPEQVGEPADYIWIGWEGTGDTAGGQTQVREQQHTRGRYR